jgi:hypothetical protein
MEVYFVLKNSKTFGQEDPFYSPQRKLAVWTVFGYLGPNPSPTGLGTKVPGQNWLCTVIKINLTGPSPVQMLV